LTSQVFGKLKDGLAGRDVTVTVSSRTYLTGQGTQTHTDRTTETHTHTNYSHTYIKTHTDISI
jgi:hypothetical protein